jgi:hypothetical protein
MVGIPAESVMGDLLGVLTSVAGTARAVKILTQSGAGAPLAGEDPATTPSTPVAGMFTS